MVFASLNISSKAAWKKGFVGSSSVLIVLSKLVFEVVVGIVD
jgi:hypothetical protein